MFLGTAGAAIAAVGTLIAALFATQLSQQWWTKRRPHALAWAIALWSYAVGMAVLAVAFAVGWSAAGFALYWITGALITVPLLAVGQANLLDPARAPLYGTLGGLAIVWAVSAVVMGEADAGALADASARGGIPMGADVYGTDTLAYGVLRPMTFGGAAVVLIGSIWSGIRSRRVGVLLIALGVAVSGTSSSFLRADADGLVAAVLTLGVAIMYVGFRAASKPPKARVRDRESSASEASEAAAG